jgi:hypothetical protein
MSEPENRVGLETWRSSFADDSGGRFAALVSADVVLVGSVLAHPTVGRDAVWSTLRLSGGIYETLEFVHETRAGDRVYFEWKATAFGLKIGGLTALELDPDGRVIRVALHHRPLGAVSRFSAELARRVAASMDGTRQPRTTSAGTADTAGMDAA